MLRQTANKSDKVNVQNIVNTYREIHLKEEIGMSFLDENSI
jgi:hypothetical protein